MTKELIKHEEAEIVSKEDLKKENVIIKKEIKNIQQFNYAQLKISDKDKEVLYAPVNENDIEIRPDGLIYLPWMEYMTRLKDVFGLEWAQIPTDKPIVKDNHVIWGFQLVIKGNIMGMAYGEQQYYSNGLMSWTDALEGAKSNALMRLCKGMGISLELWKPSFIRQWKAEYAEFYEWFNPKKQKREIRWKKKGQDTGGGKLKEGTNKAVERELKKQSEESPKSDTQGAETKKTGKDTTSSGKTSGQPTDNQKRAIHRMCGALVKGGVIKSEKEYLNGREADKLSYDEASKYIDGLMKLVKTMKDKEREG